MKIPPVFAFALCLLVLGGLVHAGSYGTVTLAWDPNPELDVSGYRVHYGTASGDYSQSLDAGNQTRSVISDLVGELTYYAAVTAYNSAGLESMPSNEIVFTTAPILNAPGEAHLVLLEAETGVATLPMAKGTDPAASGGQFIGAGTSVGAGQLRLPFLAPSAPAYHAWARVRGTAAGQGSFFFSLNDGPQIVYAPASGGTPWKNEWIWARLQSGDGSPYSLELTGGLQTMVFRSREALTGLDRIILSSDPGFVPSDAIPSGGDFVSLTTQPQSLTVFAGATTWLEVTTAATGPVTYQWFRDGIALSGATGSRLAVGNLQPNDRGDYHVQVTRGTYAALSGSATVAAIAQPVLQLLPIQTIAGGSGNDSLLLQVTGREGLPLTIEYSNDLVQWLPLQSLAPGSGTDSLIDTGILRSAKRRFYRMSPP